MTPSRAVAALLASMCLVNAALATWQTPDLVVYGGREYAINQIPMLGYWKYDGGEGTGKAKPPEFDFQSTGNWAGYTAKFEIRDKKLYLSEIAGTIGGKEKRNEEIIPGKRFPIIAKWYTGRIILQVGDQDEFTGESEGVIAFHIEEGKVTKMEFAERMTIPHSWNGLSADESEEKVESVKSDDR